MPSRNAFSASSSSAWCESLSLEPQSNLTSPSMFSGSGITHSSALRSSSLIPYGLVLEVLSENSLLTCPWSVGHSTDVLVLEEPCVDGHSTDVLAPHVSCWRHSTGVMAPFYAGKSTSLYLQFLFPFPVVWANIVWSAVLRSKSCCSVLLENSLNLAFWASLATFIWLNLPS